MAQPFATCSVTLRQEDLAQALVHIAHLSMWCEVQPLPDDVFEVRVREGEEHRVFPGHSVRRHAAEAAPRDLQELVHLTDSAFQLYREHFQAWKDVRNAVAQAWSPAALVGGAEGVVSLIKQLAADHPSRAKEVRFGGWVLQHSQVSGHPYLYASRPDKPGEIHLKADDECYVADVWAIAATEAAATCAALYEELAGDSEAMASTDVPRQR